MKGIWTNVPGMQNLVGDGNVKEYLTTPVAKEAFYRLRVSLTEVGPPE
jgi:hypothetical protein